MANDKNVLVVNCGSSSVKFAIVDPQDGKVAVSGIAEALGLDDGSSTNQGFLVPEMIFS